LTTSPRLTIVAASRNDDHGGSLLRRMGLFVRGLIEQCRRFGLPAELLMVEWNPPADAPRLHEVLPRPAAGDPLTLRVVTVPPAIHARYPLSPVIPLHQMIAKNVGIRRARAPWVLCTNVDLLFSDRLMERLASEPLDPRAYYRANRCDVPADVDPEWRLDRQLAWCEQHVIRRLGVVDGLHYTQPGPARLTPWRRRARVALHHARALARGRQPEEVRRFAALDAWACGDFTLMHRDAWEDIEGYLEAGLYALHVDSLALAVAAALGYRQVTFPPEACAYHVEHDDGWAAMKPLEALAFTARRPCLDHWTVREACLELFRRPRQLGLNAPTWGHADEDFEERVLS
jgi:hypothetical protein